MFPLPREHCVLRSTSDVVGKRHGVKLTPMQPLSAVYEQISKLTYQELNPSACKLIHNKKEIDATTPVRFANLPNGATLELRTGPGLCPR